MDWHSVWEGVLAHGIYGLLILGGGAALAVLKLRWPQYADVVRNAFVGMASIALILFALMGRGILSKRPPEITPESLQDSVRKWADDAGLGISKMPPMGEDVFFGLLLTLKSGNQVTVFRGKEKPGFLQIQTPLSMSQEHLQMLSKLSKEEADDAMEEIILEMNRSRIGWIMQTATTPPILSGTPATTRPAIFGQVIIVTRPVAISDDLSEAAFIAHIDQIDSDIGIVRGITDLTLKRYSRIGQPSLHAPRKG
jgi:hypothetical protein